jgi:hypothetical protein
MVADDEFDRATALLRRAEAILNGA